MSAGLQVENLTVEIPVDGGVLRAVENVSFSVAPGEIVGVVGESGSGKSMTAKAMLGIAPPTALATGRAFLDGEQIMFNDERSMARVRGSGLAMIFQEPGASLNPVLTIGRQLALVLKTHQQIEGDAARRASLDILKAVGIAEPESRMRAYSHELSGGMRQRVAIALAYLCQPRIMIADEPTTALDVTVQAQIVRLLKRLTIERGTGLIFVSHDIAVVAELADRILVMYGGRIVEEGGTSDVIREPRHPYTRALMRVAPTRHTPVHERLQEIPGGVPDLTRTPPGCAYHPRCEARVGICDQVIPMLSSNPGPTRAACHVTTEAEPID